MVASRILKFHCAKRHEPPDNRLNSKPNDWTKNLDRAKSRFPRSVLCQSSPWFSPQSCEQDLHPFDQAKYIACETKDRVQAKPGTGIAVRTTSSLIPNNVPRPAANAADFVHPVPKVRPRSIHSTVLSALKSLSPNEARQHACGSRPSRRLHR